MVSSSFPGFSPDALQFLSDLAAHNERSWFQPRKAEYQRLLKEPMQELCAALSVEFAARELPLDADPIRSPFRIYGTSASARTSRPTRPT